MLPQTVQTFLQALGKVVVFWHKTKKADSLISYTQTTRVEPICIIDQRALYVSYVTDILQSLNSVFAAYYLQAAALSVNVGKIDVGKFLNHLNPDRPFLESHNAALEALIDQNLLPHQDYRYGLPTTLRLGLESLPESMPHALEATDPDFKEAMDKYDEWRNEAEGHFKAGVASGHQFFDKQAAARWKGAPRPFPDEFASADYVAPVDNEDPESLKAHRGAHDKAEAARKTKFDEAKKSWDDAETKRTKAVSGQAFGTDLSKDMREAANLAVGRMYTVNITDGGHSASIPVLIRLLTTECEPNLLVHILSDGAKVKNSSAKERWFGYKLGDLRFWKDLVLCTDLIDEHKKALLHDDNGVYAEILKRRRNNQGSTAVAAFKDSEYKPTVGTASNIVITTRQTIKELEADIGGKFDSAAVRNKLFEKSYLMIVAVIDPDFDHVTFYYRGIDLPTELTVRDLKKVGKDGGDVLELFKLLNAGTAPKF